MNKILLALLLSSSFSVMAQQNDNQVVSHVKNKISCSGVSFSEEKDITIKDLKEQRLAINVESYKEQNINGTPRINDYSTFSISTLNNQRTPISNNKHSVYPVSITSLDGKVVKDSQFNVDTGFSADILATINEGTDNVKVQLCFSNTEELPATSTQFPNLDTYSTFRNFDVKLGSPLVLKLNSDRVVKIQVVKI